MSCSFSEIEQTDESGSWLTDWLAGWLEILTGKINKFLIDGFLLLTAIANSNNVESFSVSNI